MSTSPGCQPTGWLPLSCDRSGGPDGGLPHRGKSLRESDFEALDRILGESEALLAQLRGCDWRIAQTRAYLARPGGRNLTLGAVRMAQLRTMRQEIVTRLEVLELDAFNILDIP
jgi:hypothetical protein